MRVGGEWVAAGVQTCYRFHFLYSIWIITIIVAEQYYTYGNYIWNSWNLATNYSKTKVLHCPIVLWPHIVLMHDFPTLSLSHIHTYLTHLNKQSSDSSTKAQNHTQVSTSWTT